MGRVRKLEELRMKLIKVNIVALDVNRLNLEPFIGFFGDKSPLSRFFREYLLKVTYSYDGSPDIFIQICWLFGTWGKV